MQSPICCSTDDALVQPVLINPSNISEADMPASSFTVLVLEDNVDLQEFICTVLAQLGHQPHAASTADEAYDLLDTIDFDVLLADINLPGMLGSDFARLAVRKMPDLKVIFASGFGYLVSDALDFNVTLLHKPYTISQLKCALEEPPRKCAA
jgi:CheY-like chemotaxis protein